MKNGLRRLALGASFPLVCAGHASAASIAATVTASIDLGVVGAGATTNTVFRIASSNGAVTVNSGTGSRKLSTSLPITVTLTCSGGGNCNGGGTVKLSVTGSPTGRALALTNFTATTGTATVSGATGTSPMTFNFSAATFASGTSKTVTVGFDYTVNADTVAGTPASTANMLVQAGLGTAAPSGAASLIASATVYRGLSFSVGSQLKFGAIAKPLSNGTVTLSQTGGTVTGDANARPLPTNPNYPAASGQYNFMGEGSKLFTLTMPTTFNLVGASSTMTATLNPSQTSGTKTFSGAVGTLSTFAINVGGTLPVPSTASIGNYTGTFQITAVYN